MATVAEDNSSKFQIGYPPQWRQGSLDKLQTRPPSGDPLSPYLFLLVADTLQRLIRQEAAGIRHPIIPDAGCLTLQYADDTLIVL